MDNLPPSVREMVELIGLAPTLRLVEAYGGNVLRIPTGGRDTGATGMRARLVELLGEEATDRLIASYGGERITVARCAAALRDRRDRRMIEDYGRGVAVSRLAREHCLTERQVRNILKRTPGEVLAGLAGGGQLGLF